MSTPSDEHDLACEEMYEDELIAAKRAIDRMSKALFEKDEIIKRQEREIEDLLRQIKAFKPIVNEWSARQRPPQDDYYPD